MEEEKKENVTTEATPVEQAPVETPIAEEAPVETTPVEEVKEEPVSKIEDDDDEPIEMLEGASVPAPEPEPEPEAELISNTVTRVNEVVISSEPTSAPEPEPAAPPVVHKVEDSPIANAEEPIKPTPAPEPEPKKEEPKVEEKKEEPKKEEKKPKENNNKLAIILMVVALIVGAGYAVKTFILDANSGNSGTPSQQGQQPSGGESGGSGTEPVSVGISKDEAMKLVDDLIVSDSTNANYQPIERIAKNTSVQSSDFTNGELFFVTYNKYFKNQQEFTAEDFQNKVAATFADATYTPEDYSGDCNDREFKYDEETGKFKVEMLNLACAIEGYEGSVHDVYGYLGNTVNDGELVVSIGVFFGKGTDDTKEDEYYYDYERNNPVAEGVIVKSETGVDLNGTDFKRATKYDLTFNIVDGNYVFVKAEQA